MPPLPAPFPWFGGKRRVSSLVWDAIGPVDNYIEPFAGSLAVLLRRPDEHETLMPPTWRMHAYSASKAYGTTRAVGEKEGNDLNRHNERLWFSPHCLKDESLLFEMKWIVWKAV